MAIWLGKVISLVCIMDPFLKTFFSEQLNVMYSKLTEQSKALKNVVRLLLLHYLLS